MIQAALPAQGAQPDTIADQLEQVAARLDAAFLAAGNALAEAYSVVGSLTDNLAAMTAALDPQKATQAAAMLERTAEQIQLLPSAIAERSGALREIGEAQRAIEAQVFAFDRTLEFLRVCAFNIKIAAAGRGDFSAFADAMIAKLDLSGVEIRGIRQEMKELLSIIPIVGAMDRTLTIECGAVARDVPEQMIGNARALGDHLARAGRQSHEVTAIAGALQDTLAEALQAMQTGDITRQRLEHAAAGLRMMEDGGDGAADGRVAALLAAQVIGAAADFMSEAQRLKKSQEAIEPQVDGLLEVVAADRSRTDAPTGSGANLLSAIERQVEALGALTAGLRRTEERSQALGRHTGEVAERLGQRLDLIHRITAEVDNMAWNADLRCFHMGSEGLGLARVAAEIRFFVGRLEDISLAVQQAGERLNRSAAKIAGDQSDPDAAAEITLEAALAAIGEGAQRIDDSLARVGHDAAAAAGVIRNAVVAIAAIDEIATPLERAAATLRAVTPAGGDPEAPLDPSALSLLERLERSYTMASERLIHQRMLGGTGEEADAGDGDRTIVVDDDDGLF